MTYNKFLDIGQDLSIIGDEICKGSMLCANIQAEIEELELFGKEKTTMRYLDINMNELTGFANKIETYTSELNDLQIKIKHQIQALNSYIKSYQNHIF